MTHTRIRLRALMLAGAAAMAVGAAPSLAQPGADNPQDIRIDAQNLDSAIDALSAQTDLVIVAPGALLENRRSRTVAGTMTPMQALGELLRGSNLAYRRDGEAIVIEPAGRTAPQPRTPDAGTGGMERIAVTGTRIDPLNRLQTEATASLTGLSRSLQETPRAASRVSDITIERYGMENVDDLIAAVPGTFTASFFGVPGNLNVRGTLADTYFQGFKRIENRGSFSSNLGAAAHIEVLRGPSSPIYGPGKVGGLMNYVPRTARGETGYAQEVEGSLTLTAGSYGRAGVTGEIVVPVGEGGFHFYGEHIDGAEYYRNIDPVHTNLQATYIGELGGGWSFEANAMYFTESGRIQAPGWNRLTQELIDTGTYITGRDTAIQDLDGDGFISYAEIDAAIGQSGGLSNIRQIREFGGRALPEFALDEGVGLTRLSRRAVFADDVDYNDTDTFTGYAALRRDFADGGRLAFELFGDHMRNERFNSFGFAADYEATAIEARGSYAFSSQFGEFVSADSVVGAAYRQHEAQQYESFLSGYLAFDRRDLSAGATANDRIASPNIVGGERLFDTRLDMEWWSAAAFAVSDVTLYDRFSVLMGLRYDYFDVKAIDTGATVFNVRDTWVNDNEGALTWSVSARYETPFGLTPYVTYAEPRALESSQTGGVSVGNITAGLFISPSRLTEAGVKFSVLDGNLFGSVAVYEQFRRRTDPQGNVSGTTSEGFEAEAHFLASDNLSFTGAVTIQETRVDAPGAGRGEYLQIRPDQFGVDPVLGFGGTFALNNAGSDPRLADGYRLSTIPRTVASLFGTYTSDPFMLAGAGAAAGLTLGVTHASETSGVLPEKIILPSYSLVRAAAFLDVGAFGVSANIDNLFDEMYFTPSAETYKEVAAMPGMGRTFRINLRYSF
ncbi:TonB-dependent receptor [Glycocaulis profundi]|nr:TonB-dependent receptor [Glycocaulis profundi]